MIDCSLVRAVANLPEEVGAEVIRPHLVQATKDIERRAGRAVSDVSDEDEDYRSAIACQTVYYLLPVINTMYLDGVSRFARDSDDMADYVFCSPSDVERLQKYWLGRVEKILAGVEGGSGKNVMIEVV